MEAHRRDAMLSFKLRPGFSRYQYRGILRLVFLNSFVLAALCILTIYQGFYGFKAEHYFTTSPSGKIIALKYSLTPVFSPRAESPQSGQPVSSAAPVQTPSPDPNAHKPAQ